MSIHFMDMFNIDRIRTTSTLLLAVAISRDLERRGEVLDMRGVAVNQQLMVGELKKFFDNAIVDGCMLVSDSTGLYKYVSDYEIPLSFLDTDKLYAKETPDRLVWTINNAIAEYRKETIKSTTLNNMPHCIMYVLAHYLVDLHLGNVSKPLLFDFNLNESKTAAYYANILTILDDIPSLNDYVSVSVDIEPAALDYYMYLHRSYNSGHHQQYSDIEKAELLDELGFVEGGIYVLFYRDRFNANRPDGLIQQRSLVRYEGITYRNDRPYSVIFTRIPEPRTLEERYSEYYLIKPENRIYYQDLIEPPSPETMTKHEVTIYNLGIEDYSYLENNLLLHLDYEEVHNKLVSVPDEDGNMVLTNLDMRAVDCFYWVLRQWGVSFNEEAYKRDYYEEGVLPLYDQLLLDSGLDVLKPDSETFNDVPLI